MSHTNSTPNYQLPQFVNTDKPAWMADINQAFSNIDTGMHTNAENTASAAASAAAVNAAINDPDTGIAVRLAAAESELDTLRETAAIPDVSGLAASANIKYLKQNNETVIPVTKPTAILNDDGTVAVYTRAELDAILPATGYVDVTHTITVAANGAVNDVFNYVIPTGKNAQYIEIVKHTQAAQTMTNIATFSNTSCTIGVRNFINSSVTFELEIKVFYK